MEGSRWIGTVILLASVLKEFTCIYAETGRCLNCEPKRLDPIPFHDNIFTETLDE